MTGSYSSDASSRHSQDSQDSEESGYNSEGNSDYGTDILPKLQRRQPRGLTRRKTQSKVDSAYNNILAKIRKAMKLAAHPGTGEAEAKVAMRTATKLMQSQNLTQADLIANETAEERSTRAGQSTVTITSTNGKVVRKQRWYGITGSAACKAFDVQLYSTSRRNSLEWVFYGLANNTVAAALAFEMLHNQIESWAIERKGELKGHSGVNSYRRGVAERVNQDVHKENSKALKRAEEEEQKRLREEAAAAEAVRAAELARLVTSIDAEPMTSSSTKNPEVSVKVEDVPDEDGMKRVKDIPEIGGDDDDLPLKYEDGDIMYDDDMRADFDDNDDDAEDLDLDALERKVQVKSESVVAARAEPVAVKLGPPDIKCEPSDSAPSWTSALQLRTFQDNAKTIAEMYIKDTGKKLLKGRKGRKMKHDSAAYSIGWDDGKKVDLKRRRIEGQNIKREN